MISRLMSGLRGLRRRVSLNERSVRWLSLPCYPGGASARGLILIQIDGLGRVQLERALERRRMPFLRRLLMEEEYRLISIYSGIPSTTPAAQGELFFGVKGAVPAFGFRDHETGQVTSFLSMATAARVEDRLKKQGGEPLLNNASAYGAMYSGGVEHCSFAVATFGRGEMFRKTNRLGILLMFLLHIGVVVKMLALAFAEFFIAVYDMFRGVLARQNIIKELWFVPKRVVLCILFREMSAIGAQIDVTRGVPLVHANFFGYDEQSHRRGPGSRFAHLALRGIDESIRAVWEAARQSSCRNYDLWVYSDHGQELAVSYEATRRQSLDLAVAEVFARHGVEAQPAVVETATRMQHHRAAGPRRFAPHARSGYRRPRTEPVEVAADGPVAHAYTPQELNPELKERVARDLVTSADVPIVLIPDGPDRAKAFTACGTFSLPEQTEEVIGHSHPFLAEIRNDLVALAHHRDAGTFVLLGWRPSGKPVTFPIETGAHGGPGTHETHAFALLPQDVTLPFRDGGYIRHTDLRAAALHACGRAPEPENHVAAAAPKRARLRVMTYNTHSCIGLDGRHAPDRLARVIAHYDPDVVALQELDIGRARTRGLDQVRIIAEWLEMEYHFHPSFVIEQERYGNAILSRLPMRLVKAGALPASDGCEPRGILWVELQLDGRPVNLFNTHLGLHRRERLAQAEKVLGPEWIGGPECQGPVVLCGDFNAAPSSRVHSVLSRTLRDVQRDPAAGPRSATWMHVLRIDYIFASIGIRVLGTQVPKTYLTRIASDHLPFIADLEIV